MAVNVAWDSVVVWLLFSVAAFFIVRPLLPNPFRKKATKKAAPSDCTKCHP